MLKGTDSLAEHFRQYFKVVSADTQPLLRSVLTIRYRVYCEELGLEDPDHFPDGLEHDIYDQHARHALLVHRRSGEHVGCVRLILTDDQNPGFSFPFERFSHPQLRQELTLAGKLKRSDLGEISRLAVLGHFRRRSGERQTPNGVTATELRRSQPPGQRRMFPYIAPALYLTGAAMALREGLSMAFVMMEPRLARHLRRYGIVFHQVGDIVDYHGQRGPFRIERKDLFKHLHPGMRALLDAIEADLCDCASTGLLACAP